MTRLSAVLLGMLVTPLLAVFLVIGALAYMIRAATNVGYRDGRRLLEWIAAEWPR